MDRCWPRRPSPFRDRVAWNVRPCWSCVPRVPASACLKSLQPPATSSRWPSTIAASSRPRSGRRRPGSSTWRESRTGISPSSSARSMPTRPWPTPTWCVRPTIAGWRTASPVRPRPPSCLRIWPPLPESSSAGSRPARYRTDSFVRSRPLWPKGAALCGWEALSKAIYNAGASGSMGCYRFRFRPTGAGGTRSVRRRSRLRV